MSALALRRMRGMKPAFEHYSLDVGAATILAVCGHCPWRSLSSSVDRALRDANEHLQTQHRAAFTNAQAVARRSQRTSGGHLLIHARRLTAPAHFDQCQHWERTGQAWWYPQMQWWGLRCELPAHTRDSLILAGWPAFALEIGGR